MRPFDLQLLDSRARLKAKLAREITNLAGLRFGAIAGGGVAPKIRVQVAACVGAAAGFGDRAGVDVVFWFSIRQHLMISPPAFFSFFPPFVWS